MNELTLLKLAYSLACAQLAVKTGTGDACHWKQEFLRIAKRMLPAIEKANQLRAEGMQ